MSILTVAQIKDEIRSGLGNRSDLNNRLNGFIDLSLLRIARKHDFDELHGTKTFNLLVTGDAANDKYTDIQKVIDDRRVKKVYSIIRTGTLLGTGFTKPGKLRRVPPHRWDKVLPDTAYYSRGYPTHYSIWRNFAGQVASSTFRVEWWRVPDDNYTMDMSALVWPKSAADIGDGNPLDIENVDDLVINLSLSYAYHSLGRDDKAKTFFGIYSAMAREAMIEDDTELDEEMAGRFASGGFNSKGYDDPFVRSIAGDLEYEY